MYLSDKQPMYHWWGNLQTKKELFELLQIILWKAFMKSNSAYWISIAIWFEKSIWKLYGSNKLDEEY